MDEQAQQAQTIFNQTGRLRVIVQDNGPIHTCKNLSSTIFLVLKKRLGCKLKVLPFKQSQPWISV
jgi:hypothetical protein